METKRFTTKKELEKIVVYGESTPVEYFLDPKEAQNYRKKLIKEHPREEVVYKEIYSISKYIWYGK